MQRATTLALLALLAACGDDDAVIDAATLPDAAWLPDSPPQPDVLVIPDAYIPPPDAYIPPPDAQPAPSCAAPMTIVPGTPAVAELTGSSGLAPLGSPTNCGWGAAGPEGVFVYHLNHVADLTFSMSCADCDPVVYIRSDCDGVDGGGVEIPDTTCADLHGTATAEEVQLINAPIGDYYLIADTYGIEDSGTFSATLILREIVGVGAACNGITTRCGPGLFCDGTNICQDVAAFCDAGAAGTLVPGTPATGDNSTSTDTLDCDYNGAGPEDYWILSGGASGGLFNVRAVAGGTQTLFVYTSNNCTSASGSAHCDDVNVADANFDLTLGVDEEIYIVVDGPVVDGSGPYTLTADPVVVHAIGESCDPLDLRVVRCAADTWCDPLTSLCALATLESEPNETVGTADAAIAGAPIKGTRSTTSDTDTFAIELAAGQILLAETRDSATATCVSNTLDSNLTVYGPDGTTMLLDDDDSGPGYCSLGVVRATAAGTHYVELTASPYASSSGETFDYVLFLHVITPTEVAETTGDNSTSGVAQALTLPATVSGGATDGTDADWVSFALPAGVRVVAATEDGATATCATSLDSFVSLVDTDGATLLTSDDNNEDDDCSTAVWSIGAAGTYFASVRGATSSTPAFDYRFLLFTIY